MWFGGNRGIGVPPPIGTTHTHRGIPTHRHTPYHKAHSHHLRATTTNTTHTPSNDETIPHGLHSPTDSHPDAGGSSIPDDHHSGGIPLTRRRDIPLYKAFPQTSQPTDLIPPHPQ